MTWIGDYYSGCLVAGAFTTVTTTGASTQLSAKQGVAPDEVSPCLIAYRLNPGQATGFTCSDVGITLALNCGGSSGFNTYSVDTKVDPAFYTCGRDYVLMMSGGTVGGTCVHGYVVAQFGLANRAALLPQTFGRRVSLTAGYAVNINWAGV